MMKKEALIFAVLIGLAGTSVSAKGLGRGGEGFGFLRQGIESIDLNGDGAVSLDEIQAALVARYTGFDENEDGVLSQEEVIAMVIKRMSDRAEHMANEMFERLDHNEDGSLIFEDSIVLQSVFTNARERIEQVLLQTLIFSILHG